MSSSASRARRPRSAPPQTSALASPLAELGERGWVMLWVLAAVVVAWTFIALFAGIAR